MKPVNSNLGATGSFVSRVSSISSSQASIDSVVFQQGKSILDFDLNVTQDVLKNSIESLARSILSKSGFLKSITITSSYSFPNVTISIPPVDVALLGKIVRLSSSSATGTINSIADVQSSGAFFWIELWYQEIIPEGTIETGKISVIKSYGYADDNSSLSNTMKDVTFGAETTRRVQLRWRVRSAQTTSSDFTDATITARGGNQAGVAGYNFYLSNSYASSPETALGASSVKNSLLEYALLNDTGVYIAGRGTDADAQALNTVDGRVYAFSLCTVAANNSLLTNTCSVVGATTAGVLSGSSATIGNLNISSVVSATTLSIVNTSTNSSNIVLAPANSGFVSGPNFQLSGDGTVSLPALRFSSSTSTGLYYTSESTVPELNISTAGVQRLKINASALTVSGNILAQTGNAYIRVGAGSITGLGTGESMITSLNALAFRSANVSITGGSITGSLTNSATQITGTIAAVAKTNFSFVNESVFSNTITNYTPPSVTSISASHVVTPYPRNGIVFVPGTNTTLLASYDDNYVYLQITTGTSSFETASGDSITPLNYVGKPSDSWSEGVSTRPARRDHIHKREGYATTTIGVPTSLYTTLNDSALLGTADTVARGDHTHTLGSSIPAIGIGSARTSALTSVLEVTGTISGSVGHLTIRDSATNAANIGGKLSFAGVDYATATTFLSYGSIGIYREASGTNSTYASFVTRSAANLNESLRLYKNASARISTAAADYATPPADGSIEVENGAIAKYFKASSFVISTTLTTSASRFIGSVATKPLTNTNVSAGDFVIDTTGNIHVYSGSTSGWLTAGILTTAANSWTGSQQFGASRTWAETSSLTNTASAINMSSYNITLSAAQGSDSVRTMYVGGNVVTSAASSTISVAANKVYAITAIGTATNWSAAGATGTLDAYPTQTANRVDYFTAGSTTVTLNQLSSTVTELLPLLTASTQDINGPPSFAGYSYIINSYGLRILTKAVAANTYPISGTSAYGLQVGIPTKASVVYGIHIPTVIATNSAYAYGLHVTAPTGATNNYGIYVSSGSVVLADATASTNSTSGALQVAGGIYVTKASIFAGTVSLSNTDASTSSTTGALQVAGGIYAGKASVFADVVSLSNNGASTSSTTGALQVAGGIYAGQASVFAGTVSLSNNGASTSSTTGALQVAGGIYAGKASVFTETINGVKIGIGLSPTGTVLGKTAGNLTGNNNTAIGNESQSQSGASATGSQNTSVGSITLKALLVGTDNTAVGFSAATSHLASNATAVGSQALLSSTTGNGNTAVGASSVRSVTTGEYNTSVGFQSLYSAVTAGTNTAVGSNALYSTTGAGNVAVGYSAGKYETGSNAFYVDNQDRTNTNGDKEKALLYGTFDTTAAGQTLKINAGTVTVLGKINGLTLTAATTGFTIAGGTTSKTLTVSNTMKFAAGADEKTFTFPDADDTVATLSATQILSSKTLSSPVITTGFTLQKISNNTALTTAPGTDKVFLYVKTDSAGILNLYYQSAGSTGEFALTSSTPGFIATDEGLVLSSSGGGGGGGGGASVASANTWSAEQTFAPVIFQSSATAPSAPGGSNVKLYAKNGALYYKLGTSETENQLLAGSGATTGIENTFALKQTFSLGIASNAASTFIGGLTVSSGGASISGNTAITGTLSSSNSLSVAAGGAAIVGNSTFQTNAAAATSSFTSLDIRATDASSTANIVKTAVSITSSGNLTGSSSVNRALYVTATSSAGATNYAAIFDGGSVGIGTTTPTARLHMSTGVSKFGSSNAYTDTTSHVFSNSLSIESGSGGAFAINTYYDSTASSSSAWKYSSSGYGWRIQESSGDLIFSSAGLTASGHGASASLSETMRINNAGGLVVAKGGLTVTLGGLIVSAGGLTVTLGGLTVSAGGLSVGGNSTITGTLNVTTGLTVSAGGLTVTLGGLIVSAGGLSVTAGGLTVTAGGLSVGGNSSITGTLYVSSTVSGGIAPRCFIPAGAFTSSTAALGTESTSGQFQYTFAGGNTAYVYLVVPANYGGGACSFTIHGTTTNNLAVTYGTTSAATSTFTSGTTTLTASIAYYIKLTCAASQAATLTGMSIVFGG